jgi:murein L,D-transpeptidase YcbB/YkuD
LEVSQDVISVQTLQDIARTSMLLEQEMLVKVEEYGQSPLFLAAVEGHLEAIQVRFGWTTDGI